MLSPDFDKISKSNERPQLSYFKILPHNDHQLDPKLWVQNPSFLRFEYLKTGIVGGQSFYRFLVVVDDETVSLHIGFPPDKKRSVEAALRGALPKVTVLEEPNPLEKFFGEGEDPHAAAFTAVSDVAPFNCDESLSEFQSILAAFGAGRRDGVKGVYDVCFEYSPHFKKKMLSALTRELEKMYGISKPLIGGADLGASFGDIIAALNGGKGSKVVPLSQKQAAQKMLPADREKISAYSERGNAAGVFRVRMRAAACAGSPKKAGQVLKAAAAALQSAARFNSFTWQKGRPDLVRNIASGRIGFLEKGFLMTERELAQFIVVPGQEMEFVWRVLEKMPSRTAPPPMFLLGGGDDDGEAAEEN